MDIIKKRHNPKAHAPALYIPCWLIQVPTSLISNSAKMLYGRLAQWSSETGEVYRSANQLSVELGTAIRNIERYLKELRELNLIGTLQPQAGGVNHFEFYDHEWMHEPINQQLAYKNDNHNAPSRMSEPPVKDVGTPPLKVADINIKEIKRNKHTHSGVEYDLFLEVEQQRKALMLRDKTVEHEKCKELYEQLPQEVKDDKSFEEIHDECVIHYATQKEPQMVSPQRLMSWIKREIKYHANQHKQPETYQKPGDSFNQYMKSQKQGATYDQHGNTYDPLR